MYTVTFLPKGISVKVHGGTSVLQAQIQADLHPDAPCGGKGTCGKCKVEIQGKKRLACQTMVDQDLTVTLPEQRKTEILLDGVTNLAEADGEHDYAAAFDIGTTTLAGFLMNGRTGELLAEASAVNPQTAYGADVISRIQAVMEEKADLQTELVRILDLLITELAEKAGIGSEQITLVTIVGNTAMHHLFLGIDPAPLVIPPYMPKSTEAMELSCGKLLPVHPEGMLRILPNIAGFVGADTVGCMLAAQFDKRTDLTLLIDIGTNGEMVLGDQNRRVACSTAAGPALEGAKISCGMRGCIGAIDRFWLEGRTLCWHVIGETVPVGICGSGLLDLIACLLDAGILDESGYLKGGAYTVSGTDLVLTQADVREVQLAKAAIRAGIELLCDHLQVTCQEVQTVLLAGAFGNYMDPRSACRIGMIPGELFPKMEPIGNAAGEGARLCALSRAKFEKSQTLAAETEFLELASKPEFQDQFVDALEFGENGEDNEGTGDCYSGRSRI